MEQYIDTIRDPVEGITLRATFRGGTGTLYFDDFIDDRAEYDLVIVMLRGNDMAKGASIADLTQRYRRMAAEATSRDTASLPVDLAAERPFFSTGRPV